MYKESAIAADPLRNTKRGTILYDNKEYDYFVSYIDDCRVVNVVEKKQDIIEKTL